MWGEGIGRGKHTAVAKGSFNSDSSSSAPDSVALLDIALSSHAEAMLKASGFDRPQATHKWVVRVGGTIQGPVVLGCPWRMDLGLPPLLFVEDRTSRVQCKDSTLCLGLMTVC